MILHTALIAFFIFILGTIIGSFLNVVILRYNTGLPIFSRTGRSQCFSCGKVLEAAELVPLFSFIFLRGKCSVCKSKISWQYPLVEFITGLIFLSIFIKDTPSFVLTLFHFIVWSIFIVIAFYDIKHKIIPNGLVYGLITLTFIGAVFFASPFNLANLLAGPLFFLFFGSLWFFSDGRWIGFGDAKLVLAVGFLLGLVSGASALVLSFWIGAVFGILTILYSTVRNSRLRTLGKNLTMKSEIPFAPFIILGTLIAFFCQLDILGIGKLFF